MTTLFDTYVIVDWSASSRPKQGKDSIWVCVLTVDGVELALDNPPTRHEATGLVRSYLLDQCSAGRRVLVGFDFPYGYPAGLASQLGLGGSRSWRVIWRYFREHVSDGSTNANNRFDVAAGLNRRIGCPPGPFWGCPSAGASSTLNVRRLCTFPFDGRNQAVLAEYRISEQRLRQQHLRVQATWKLMGAGSVGSQALLGIPVLEDLRSCPGLQRVSHVWPFETGLSPPQGAGPKVIHAEIWPGVVEVDMALHPVKDAAQVRSLARRLAELDRSGELGQLFAPPIGPDEAEKVTDEEGWILGA